MRDEQVGTVARVLAPRSIAIVGVSRRPGTIGRALVRNVLAGGFTGAVHPVNPHATELEGLPASPAVSGIPGPVDLAVIAVHAPAVRAVVEDCIAKQVRGIVVITSGFAEVGAGHAERDLVDLVRANGMRMVGPNCFGIANTRADVSLNATFSPVAPTPGRIGVASQSGGVGIDLLARLSGTGLGISSFVSLGNKADVSTNDLLEYWADDPETDVVVLYVESFGNPRKFARIARRLADTKAVLAVKSGRSPAGARGTASHTAALMNPDVAVSELFRQAGVVRVDTLEELIDTASLVTHQPLPRGRRVAVVSNGGGPGILAADACAAAGLAVDELSDGLQRALRAVTSPEAAVTNPVDLVSSADAATFERAITTILRSGEVDALVAICVATSVTDPASVQHAVVTAAASTDDVPVAACFLGAGTGQGPLAGDDGRLVPCYPFPESAAGALERAVRLSEWRAAPRGTVPHFGDLDVAAARAAAHAAVLAIPGGSGWLDVETAASVLSAAGVPIAPTRRAATADDAVAAADALGYPVVLKAGAAALVHKTDRGGVALGLADAAAVRAAFARMAGTLGDEMGGALVQAMAAPGVEMIVGVTHDPTFGPLVLLGLGGTTAELVRDTTVRLVPMTDADASTMVRSLRTSPLLFGYRGAPAVDITALEHMLLRIAQLADAVPEIAELDCNPVIVSTGGALTVDVKMRIAPVAGGTLS